MNKLIIFKGAKIEYAHSSQLEALAEFLQRLIETEKEIERKQQPKQAELH